MKMIMKVPDVPDLTARINEYLPPDIRLWGFVCIFVLFTFQLAKFLMLKF